METYNIKRICLIILASAFVGLILVNLGKLHNLQNKSQTAKQFDSNSDYDLDEMLGIFSDSNTEDHFSNFFKNLEDDTESETQPADPKTSTPKEVSKSLPAQTRAATINFQDNDSFESVLSNKALEIAIRYQFSIDVDQVDLKQLINSAIEINHAQKIDLNNYGCYCRFDQQHLSSDSWTVAPFENDPVDQLCSEFKDANVCLAESEKASVLGTEPATECNAITNVGQYQLFNCGSTCSSLSSEEIFKQCQVANPENACHAKSCSIFMDFAIQLSQIVNDVDNYSQDLDIFFDHGFVAETACRMHPKIEISNEKSIETQVLSDMKLKYTKVVPKQKQTTAKTSKSGSQRPHQTFQQAVDQLIKEKHEIERTLALETENADKPLTTQIIEKTEEILEKVSSVLVASATAAPPVLDKIISQAESILDHDSNGMSDEDFHKMFFQYTQMKDDFLKEIDNSGEINQVGLTSEIDLEKSKQTIETESQPEIPGKQCCGSFPKIRLIREKDYHKKKCCGSNIFYVNTQVCCDGDVKFPGTC